jgi:hypothetical protein
MPKYPQDFDLGREKLGCDQLWVTCSFSRFVAGLQNWARLQRCVSVSTVGGERSLYECQEATS